jgi:Tol biopolymer transport system component
VTGDASAHFPSISNDGRYVVFQSGATNLLASEAEDRVGFVDVYVRDRVHRTTVQIPPPEGGEGLNLIQPCMSSNGRFIAYITTDEARWPLRETIGPVYLYDRITGRTDRIADEGSMFYVRGCVSDDGRYVIFDHASEVHLADRLTHQTRRITQRVDACAQPSSSTFDPSACAGQDPRLLTSVNSTANAAGITPDGRFVAVGAGGGRAPGDANQNLDLVDVYVYDIWRETLMRVSVADNGQPEDRDATNCGISDDGRSIVYDSSPEGIYGYPLGIAGARDSFSVWLLERKSST